MPAFKLGSKPETTAKPVTPPTPKPAPKAVTPPKPTVTPPKPAVVDKPRPLTGEIVEKFYVKSFYKGGKLVHVPCENIGTGNVLKESHIGQLCSFEEALRLVNVRRKSQCL
jgi:hypothetical protein